MVINDWISVSPDNGCGEKTVTITLGKNETGSSRTYQIPVYFDDGSVKYITVNQPACGVTPTPGTTLTVTPSSISFDSAGGSSTIIIESTADWIVTSYPDWATLSETSGTSGTTSITVTITQNTETSRADMIIVTSGGKTASVNVMQAGAVAADCPTSFTASQNLFTFPLSGGTATFTVETDGDCYFALGSDNTFTITPTHIMPGTTTMTVTCNSGDTFYSVTPAVICSEDVETKVVDMGYFWFKREDIDASTLKVNPDSLLLNWKERKGITVKSEGVFTASNIPSWIDVLPISGGEAGATVTKNVNITPQNNTGISDRTGIFLISNNKMGINVNVKQFGKVEMITGTYHAASTKPSVFRCYKYKKGEITSSWVLTGELIPEFSGINFTVWKKLYDNVNSISLMGDGFLTIKFGESFDSSNLLTTSELFRGCKYLTEADLSYFDLSNVQVMTDMFSGCTKLTTVKVINCDSATQQKILTQLQTDLSSSSHTWTLSNGIITRS